MLIGGCQTFSYQKSTPVELTGNWKVEQIMGQPSVDYSPVQINFEENGRLTGNNSCNLFFGTYKVDGSQLTLTPGGATMKACVDSLMAQEKLFNLALPQVKSAEMKNGKLILEGSAGKSLLVLTKL